MFNVIVWGSLVLFVGTAALSVRSYFTGDTVGRTQWNSAQGMLTAVRIGLFRGRLKVQYHTMMIPANTTGFFAPPNVGSWGHVTGSGLEGERPDDWSWWYAAHSPRTNFLADANRTLGWTEEWRFGLCLWLLIGIFAMPPALWILQTVAMPFCQRLRHNPGSCPTCGYDLRATPDRCPECGTTVGTAVK